jgi:RHS repeat-associated protein
MIEVADSNAAYYYHYDSLGSVIALSDSTGDTVQTYEYSVFGEVAVEDANHTNPYMFAGRRYDIEIGLYYNRARYYNPYTGRFLQTDPIGYGDGMNMYAYCGSNPVALTDPTGQWASYGYDWIKDGGGNWVLSILCYDDAGQQFLGTDFYFSSWNAVEDYLNNCGDFCDGNFDRLAFDDWASEFEGNLPPAPTGTTTFDWIWELTKAAFSGGWDGLKLTANGATFDLLPDDLIDRDALYDRYGKTAFASEACGATFTVFLTGAGGAAKASYTASSKGIALWCNGSGGGTIASSKAAAFAKATGALMLGGLQSGQGGPITQSVRFVQNANGPIHAFWDGTAGANTWVGGAGSVIRYEVMQAAAQGSQIINHIWDGAKWIIQ